VYEDLESIANLRIGEVIDRESRDEREKLSATLADISWRGVGLESGAAIQVRIDSATRTCDRISRAFCEIWLDLIEQRNQGRLSRPDVDFINTKIKQYTDGQIRNIVQAVRIPTTFPADYVMNQAQRWASNATSDIGRELEIKLHEQEAFPPPDLSFWGFIRAFGEGWTTMMSGPLTVPFAIAALYLPGYPRPIFASLAVVCGLYSSYHVWRKAKSESWRSKPAKH
jgi:hypothetical protein